MKDPDLVIDALTDKIKQLEKKIHDEQDDVYWMWSFFYEFLFESGRQSLSDLDRFFEYVINESDSDNNTASKIGKIFTDLIIDNEQDGEYQSKVARDFLAKFDSRNLVEK